MPRFSIGKVVEAFRFYRKIMTTWDCVHPAAILARLMSGTNVDDKIIMNTLECWGYVDKGEINKEDSDRQFELFGNSRITEETKINEKKDD